MKHLGFFKQYDPSVKAGSINLSFQEPGKTFFKELVEMPPPTDGWIRTCRDGMLEAYGSFLGYAQLANDPRMRKHCDEVLPYAQKSCPALIGMTSTLLQYAKNKEIVELAQNYLNAAKAIQPENERKFQRARIHYLEGKSLLMLGDTQKALVQLRASIKLNTLSTNPAHALLQEVKKRAEKQAAASGASNLF